MKRIIVLAILLLAGLAVLVFAKGKLYTGDEDHSVTRAEAADFVRNFHDNRADDPRAFYFGRKAIEAILAQDGVVGIRIYNGMNAEGVENRVLVGVDANGMDLVDGALAEKALICPPSCGQPNAFEIMSSK